MNQDNECPESVLSRHPWAGTRSSAQVGALRELAVAADLMQRGYQVFRNLAPCGIDLVLFDGAKFIAVEVATGGRSRATGAINRPNKSRSRYEILAVVAADGEIAYFNRGGEQLDQTEPQRRQTTCDMGLALMRSEESEDPTQPAPPASE